MPTVGYLRSLLKKADHQVKVLQSVLQQLDGELIKIQKKKFQFESLLKFRSEDVEKIKQEIEKLQHKEEKPFKTLS